MTVPVWEMETLWGRMAVTVPTAVCARCPRAVQGDAAPGNGLVLGLLPQFLQKEVKIHKPET